jgi:hypothetical protein
VVGSLKSRERRPRFDSPAHPVTILLHAWSEGIQLRSIRSCPWSVMTCALDMYRVDTFKDYAGERPCQDIPRSLAGRHSVFVAGISNTAPVVHLPPLDVVPYRIPVVASRINPAIG